MALSWEALEQSVKNWVSHPTQRPFVGSVAATPSEKAIVAGERFVPEASYFGVRLIEMSLSESGRYFMDFLPMGVCLTEYTFGDQRQRIPTILNNELIASQFKNTKLQPGYVDLTNISVVRRAPVKADNLSLFVGLFRMPYTDLAKQVLQIAADLTEQTGIGAPYAGGLRIAEKVYDRVAGLFQLNVMSPRFGYADGNALTESGYLLIAGPAANKLPMDRLRVVDGQLHLDGKRATGFDYCLVGIEHTTSLLPDGGETINPLTGLGFHARWKNVAKLLAQRNVTDAEAEMPQLRAEVLLSPELTEEDRLVAIAAYDTSYEKLRQALAPRADAGPTTRAARSDLPANGLRSEAAARTAAGQSATGGVLREMADRLQIPNANEDPDAVFAEEAAALRATLSATDRSRPHLAATVAEAIGGALTRREE